MPSKKRTYHKNFIAGVKHLMAEHSLATLKEAAAFLDMSYMGLYKIMDGTNNPTADAGITLCKKAGYDANWLFLSEGDMKRADGAEKLSLLTEIKSINRQLSRLKVSGKT